jgi:hypothetical protein
VGLYQGLLFYSIGLHDCFCSSSMLILLQWHHSIVWSQVLVLPALLFWFRLLWLFEVFCAFIWILRFACVTWWRMLLEFW